MFCLRNDNALLLDRYDFGIVGVSLFIAIVGFKFSMTFASLKFKERVECSLILHMTSAAVVSVTPTPGH